jgi:hypothetical protein
LLTMQLGQRSSDETLALQDNTDSNELDTACIV